VGAEVKFIPMREQDDFVVDFDALDAADLRRAKLMIVNYPNNPTGARVGKEFYDRAVAFARRHGLLLVSDVAYSELTFDGKPAPSALQSDPGHEVTIEFHSCSKTFSMAGLRIGFGVGNAAAIEALAAYRSNLGYGTAAPIQHAAAYALEHLRELVPPTVALYRARRDAMAVAFRRSGWDVPVPDATMYFWLPVP
jgi:aspartate/methionine/tyrosine aminotransferase